MGGGGGGGRGKGIKLKIKELFKMVYYPRESTYVACCGEKYRLENIGYSHVMYLHTSAPLLVYY